MQDLQKAKKLNIFSSSAKSICKIQNIALCGMFMALAVAAEALVIQTPILKISFGFLMFALCGLILGPVAGMIFGASVDLIGVMVSASGAPYLPLTVVAAISGLLYGIILYRPAPLTLKEPMPLWRILAAQTVNDMLCNAVLNTACLAMLQGKAFFAIFGLRLLKNFILLPFEVILLTFIIRTVEKFSKRGIIRK